MKKLIGIILIVISVNSQVFAQTDSTTRNSMGTDMSGNDANGSTYNNQDSMKNNKTDKNMGRSKNNRNHSDSSKNGMTPMQDKKNKPASKPSTNTPQ